MTNEKAVAEKLLHAEAVKINAENPFTWSAGWKSPVYCDNRRLLSFPFIRDYIKSELCNVIFERFEAADYIAGVATAGIAWGAMAADQLKMPFVYVRNKSKEHGLQNRIEGYMEAGKSVVIVEDLISTGKSSMETAHTLIEAGMKVEGVVSIFNYDFQQAKRLFEENNIPVFSLSNYPALLEVALDKKLVSDNSLPVLLQWRNDPENWQLK